MSDKPQPKPAEGKPAPSIFRYLSPAYYAREYLRGKVIHKIEEETPDSPVLDSPGNVFEKRKTSGRRMYEGDFPSIQAMLSFMLFADNVIGYVKSGGDKHFIEDSKEVSKQEMSTDLKSGKFSRVKEGVKTYVAASLVDKTVDDEIHAEVKQNAIQYGKQKAKQVGAEFGFSFAVGLGISQLANKTKNPFGRMAMKGAGKGWMMVGMMTIAYMMSDIGKKTKDPPFQHFESVMKHHQKKRPMEIEEPKDPGSPWD